MINAWKDKMQLLINDFDTTDITMENITEHSIAIVEFCVKLMQENSYQLAVNSITALHYETAFKFKKLAILLRDINFRAYKDAITAIENKTVSSSITINQSDTKILLQNINNEIIDELALLQTDNILQKKLDAWQHETNPNAIIVEQLQKLIEHIKLILQSYKNLEVVNADLIEYKVKLIDITSILNDQANFAINQIESFLQTIKQDVSNWQIENLQALEKYIDKTYKTIEIHKTKYSFTELDINTLEQCEIASDVSEGELLIKTIDFKEEISAWLEAEIYPVFYDLKNLSEQIHDRCLLSLINVNNRVKEILQQIKLKENLPYNMETVLQPIVNIPKNANKILKELVSKNERLAKIIENNLETTNVFNNNDYFIYRINVNKETNGKIIKYKSGFLERNYNKFKRGLKKYFYKDDDTVLNLLDTFDFIQHNTIQQQDVATTSLFLKKGYIGKSFLVERNDVYQLTKIAINEWTAGNKGALLVYGDALTGKSTILESINLAIPKLPVIYLKPHTTIHYKSRNFEVAYNLEDALKFINKYIYQDKVIVTLDDLELWRDKQNSLYDNINTFIYNINKYNKSIFFIVSTNGWMKHHLDTYFRFKDYFIAEYCTNFTSNDDILRAIVLRYIASIKEDNQSASWDDENQKIEKYIQYIIQHTHNNIGACLKHFYLSTRQKYEHILTTPDSFVDLIENNRYLLKYILKFKKTNEAEMLKNIGVKSSRSGQLQIQNLLNCKVLVRNNFGEINVNKAIIDYVEHILHDFDLKFNYD